MNSTHSERKFTPHWKQLRPVIIHNMKTTKRTAKIKNKSNKYNKAASQPLKTY